MINSAILSLLLATGPVADDTVQRQKCAAALGYLTADHPDARASSNVVYASRPASVLPAGMGDTAWFDYVSKERRETPSDDLRAQLYLHNLSAIETCPSVRNFLKERRIKFGKSAVKAAEWNQRASGGRATIRYLSLPALTDDARDAILGVEVQGGGIWSVLLQRQPDGSWKIEAQSSGMEF